MLAGCLLLTLSGCAKKEEESRFGMDINRLNPLITYATDCESGETAFSRDPSIISAVATLFDTMELRPAAASDGQGIRFTVATMFGDFLFGECWDDRLRLNGKEYTVGQDNEETIRLLYGRLVSETQHTGDVSRQTILAVKPGMTYRELMDRFGPTLETAVVGVEKAYLYQTEGRPFYILFKRDTDTVGMTGEQLLEEIGSNFNLAQSLTAPEPLGSGRLAVYKQAFGQLIEQAAERPSLLRLDTSRLVYLNEEERAALTRYLEETYSLSVLDGREALLVAETFLPQESGREMTVWIDEYSYIGEKTMTFTAAMKKGGEDPVARTMTFQRQGDEWKED